jgi:hypothetical protein
MTGFWQMSSVLLAILLSVTASAGQTAAAQSSPPPCTQPEQKQFDFWIGNWDLTWPGNNPNEIVHGTNNIKRVMDGCVVEENFSGGHSTHLRGMSVSLFDARAGKWKQTWVDNEDGYLDFIGEFKDGQMILGREAVGPGGRRPLQRMVFKNITANAFDWSWESSKDDGKTWQVQWPIHYRRKP